MIDRKELVEKMASAGWEQYCPIVPDMRSDTWKAWMAGMDAALSVAIEELLKEPSDVERKVFYAVYAESNRPTTAEDREAALETVIANRRAQLERVKTPEERVTIGMDHNGWYVMKDMVCLQDHLKEGIAYAARLGLIQQLTAELPKNQ